jgi:SAM-dependent methyltransferase
VPIADGHLDQWIRRSASIYKAHLEGLWREDFTAIHGSFRDVDRLYMFLRQRLGSSDIWRFGPNRQAMELGSLLGISQGRIDFRGARFLDIGCGMFHPFGISTLAVALGATSCTATDMVAIEDESRAARAVWDLMAATLMNPRELLDANAPPIETVCANLHRHFDAARLQKGELYAAVREGLEHKTGSFFDLDFPVNYFTISHSHTVLEHIHDMDRFAKRLHDMTAPGGWSYHLIDLRDHRIYTRPDQFAWWHFLKRAEHDDQRTRRDVLQLCNRLRAPAHLAAFEKVGFEIVEAWRTCEEIPPEAIEDFEPEYQALSGEDLHTAILHVLIRRNP